MQTTTRKSKQRKSQREPARAMDWIRSAALLIVLGGVLAALTVLLPKQPLGAAVNRENGDAYVASPSVTLRFTEVMARNVNAFPNATAAFEDWVELTNEGEEPLDLLGLGLSDEASRVRFTFPEITLAPGECILVYADNQHVSAVGQELHAKFKISSLGETLYLFDLHGRIADQVAVQSLDADISYALTSTGWTRTAQVTPGYPNTQAGYQAFQALADVENCPLVLSEIMAASKTSLVDEDGEFVDWIELYNRDDAPVDLAQYALSDDPAKLVMWRFPQGATIPAGGYYVVYATGKNRAEAEPYHTNFRISAEHETVLLSDIRGHIIDETTLDNLKDNTVWQRQNSGDQWTVSQTPTPGEKNR